MKMKYLVFALPLLVFIGCEDEEAAFDCTAEMTTLSQNPFMDQFSEMMAAALMGDTTYETPADYKTNCDAYTASMQKLFDEGCYAPEDSVTQESIDAFSEFCVE